MYKLDDHVACAVAGITGEPFCGSSLSHIQLLLGCVGAELSCVPQLRLMCTSWEFCWMCCSILPQVNFFNS